MKILILLLLVVGLIACTTTPEYDSLSQALWEVREQQNIPTQSYAYKPSGRGLPTQVHEFEPERVYTSAVDTECVSFAVGLLANLHNKGIQASSILVKEPLGNQLPEWNHMMVKSGIWYMDNNMDSPVLKEDLYGYKFKE